MQAMIVIAILGFMSNQNPTSQQHISAIFNRLTCPLPIANGVDNDLTAPGINMTYNVDINGNPGVAFGASSGNNPGPVVGTQYICGEDPVFGSIQISAATKEYAASCFSIFPCGFFGYLNDFIGGVADKLAAFFTLIYQYLSPIDFNILGFQLSDLNTTAQVMVLTFYAIEYIIIGISIYKIVSPYTHVG
jgi:hypothetical protein